MVTGCNERINRIALDEALHVARTAASLTPYITVTSEPATLTVTIDVTGFRVFRADIFEMWGRRHFRHFRLVNGLWARDEDGTIIGDDAQLADRLNKDILKPERRMICAAYGDDEPFALNRAISLIMVCRAIDQYADIRFEGQAKTEGTGK